MNSVLVFCPTYKQEDGKAAMFEDAAASLKKLHFKGKMDVEISTDNPYPPPNYDNVLHQYRKARRMVLDGANGNGGYDALLTVEHDIVAPADGLQELWDTCAPVAYGVYLFRGSQNMANVFRRTKEGWQDMGQPFYQRMLANALEKRIIEVEGCGFGFTLIRREVLRLVDFRQENRGKAPDMPFAEDCKQAGFWQVAHFGVQCGHIIDKGRTIYLNLDFAQERKVKVTILRYFTAGGVAYRDGKDYVIPESTALEFTRLGYAKVIPTPPPYRPWVYSDVKSKEKKLTVSVKAIQRKAAPLIHALMENGHTPISADRMGDCLLTDHDMDEHGYRDLIEKFWRAGKPAFIYPHGAAPILSWDGMREVCELVKGNLVTAPGHAEVMRRYGYPIPIYVIGWYLCDLLPFKKAEGMRVLYGPIHPVRAGSWQYPEDLKANTRTFERLLGVPGIDLTVRHIHGLQVNGIREVPGVKYSQARPDNTYDDIDRADIVVSNGTLAYLAIARGKPTVMLQQMTSARDLAFEKVVRAKSVEKYEGYMRYPYDVEDGDDLGKILREAGKREPKTWKKRFIGEPFKSGEFCQLLEKLVEAAV